MLSAVLSFYSLVSSCIILIIATFLLEVSCFSSKKQCLCCVLRCDSWSYHLFCHRLSLALLSCLFLKVPVFSWQHLSILFCISTPVFLFWNQIWKYVQIYLIAFNICSWLLSFQSPFSVFFLGFILNYFYFTARVFLYWISAGYTPNFCDSVFIAVKEISVIQSHPIL